MWDSLDSLTGPEAVEPYFRHEKNRLAGLKAIQREAKMVEARAQEWREVGYPQAIAQLEKEFGVTEEEVGVDSSFSLKEIREAFQWLTAQNKKDERKNEEDAAKQAEKEKLRKKNPLKLKSVNCVFDVIHIRVQQQRCALAARDPRGSAVRPEKHKQRNIK